MWRVSWPLSAAGWGSGSSDDTGRWCHRGNSWQPSETTPRCLLPPRLLRCFALHLQTWRCSASPSASAGQTIEARTFSNELFRSWGDTFTKRFCRDLQQDGKSSRDVSPLLQQVGCGLVQMVLLSDLQRREEEHFSRSRRTKQWTQQEEEPDLRISRCWTDTETEDTPTVFKSDYLNICCCHYTGDEENVEEVPPGRPPPAGTAGTSGERPGDDPDQSGSAAPAEAREGLVPGAGRVQSEGAPWVRRRRRRRRRWEEEEESSQEFPQGFTVDRDSPGLQQTAEEPEDQLVVLVTQRTGENFTAWLRLLSGAKMH